MPPFLAGRDREKSQLRSMLHRLQAGERNSEAVLLHGPRGNGKTVMLRWLRIAAGDKFNVRRIKARFVSDPSAVAISLLANHRDGSLEETIPAARGDVIPDGIQREGNGQLTRRQIVSRSLDMAMRQAAKKKPLLMIMDEAHTADPTELGTFVNSFQDSAEAEAMRLVLAGTPDVRNALSAADATFADRMRKLPFGHLAPEAGQAAIAQPFADNGIEVDGGVCERLARWAENYPYFLQLIGEAAWEEAANFGRLTEEAGEAAIKRARVSRDEYFSIRYEELAAEGLVEFGAAVAAAVCSAGGQRIKNVDVEKIARDLCGSEWKAAIDFIVRKGFLWRPHLELSFQAGIPSLMNYTIKRHQIE